MAAYSQSVELKSLLSSTENTVFLGHPLCSCQVPLSTCHAGLAPSLLFSYAAQSIFHHAPFVRSQFSLSILSNFFTSSMKGSDSSSLLRLFAFIFSFSAFLPAGLWALGWLSPFAFPSLDVLSSAHFGSCLRMFHAWNKEKALFLNWWNITFASASLSSLVFPLSFFLSILSWKPWKLLTYLWIIPHRCFNDDQLRSDSNVLLTLKYFSTLSQKLPSYWSLPVIASLRMLR